MQRSALVERDKKARLNAGPFCVGSYQETVMRINRPEVA
jgi:hypothetical protein